NSRNNLAYAHESAGRLEEAITLYAATLADSERILGPEHPDTLATRHNLAGAYRTAGRLREAIALYQQTVADRERILGAEHPDTLSSRNNLAYAHESAGRLEEAITLYAATLADSERILGPEHPATLATRHNLAGAYRTAGRLRETIPLLQRMQGADHPISEPSGNAVDASVCIERSTVAHNEHSADSSALETRLVVGRVPEQPPHFVDRAQVNRLRLALNSGPVVVTGMRGTGKTQVAAAYAREAMAGSAGLVGWVNAETTDTTLADLAKVAARVGVADPDGDSVVSARQLLGHLSEREGPALLVFDGAADPHVLYRLLPSDGNTQVVVTSTDRAFAPLGQVIDVGGGFTRDESVRYLEEATGLDDPHGAALVAADVGDLPLALSAAVATIIGRRLDYPRYRRLLNAQPLLAVLPRSRGSEYLLAVDQALLLSIHAVENSTSEPEVDETVRWLLPVMAMLAPDGVDYTSLPRHDGRLDAALQRCVEGSVLTRSTTGHVVLMHRLVARVVRERIYSTHTTKTVAAAVFALISPLLFDEAYAFQRREEGDRLVDHVEALWGAVSQAPDLDTDTLTTALNTRRWATRHLIQIADTTRSVVLAQQSLNDHERILGPDHPDTLASRNDLARAFESAGQRGEAIDLFERTLADFERVLGSDHPKTGAVRRNLAAARQHERDLSSDEVLGD
ncbi:tetratricopeptide repeat protein, partial [Nocardia sp. NPDC058519]|uniref:tetratricopeptide repeat protein n=1 Tax=Nocardia sp. NPDC058519 TaxID=3346535 RepID=UPI003658B235